MNEGASVWVENPDPKQKFLRAGVIARIDAKSVTVTTQNGQLITVPAGGVRLMDTSSQEGVADMTSLSDLHEGSLLHNIRLRYQQDLVYTYVGSILVAVNPYKLLKIYDPESVRKYRGALLGDMPPHIFAIADNAYNSMLKDAQSQCVIISGESGAGKTESTKLILQYLAMLSGKHSQIEERILASSPILESFGNACTVRNNNSSRFGKFIEIQFNEQGQIQGGRINEYLLEKSRIVSQAAKERNYHSFYCLLSGATEQELKGLKLTKAQDYAILNQGGMIKVDGIDDAEDFEKLKTALDNLGCGDAVQRSIWTMLALILHLGNITFAVADGHDDQANVRNKTALENASALMDIPADILGKALTSRTSVTRNETFTTPLSVAQSNDSRDALAKSLYSWLFGWLVRSLNDRIHHSKSKQVIGVLDIFGFEDFAKNSFEQLCINYANERLQQFFNQHIFKLEQEEYRKESISWADVAFVDNQPCLELISKKPLGILMILDEESSLPKCTDKTFLEKVRKNHDQHPYFVANKTSDATFGIMHYAGKVVYQLDGFLEKNRDLLRPDLEKVCLQSGFKFLGDLISSGIQDDQAKKAMLQTINASKMSTAAAKSKTAASKFEESLVLLLGVLMSCHPHFVRCVKPNSLKKANIFDEEMILQQLRYSGLLETVKIRKSGYPMRRTFKDFVTRYSSILYGQKKAGSADEKEKCVQIIRSVGGTVTDSQYQVGRTRIFYREGLDTQVEKLRAAARTRCACVIQRRIKGFMAVLKYKSTRRAIRRIQRVWRAYRVRKQNRHKVAAATKIQALHRGIRTRMLYKKKIEAVKMVQAALRIRLSRAILMGLFNQAETRANSENSLRAHNLEKERVAVASDLLAATSHFSRDRVLVDSFDATFTTSFHLPSHDSALRRAFEAEDLSGIDFAKYVQAYFMGDSATFTASLIKSPVLSGIVPEFHSRSLQIFACIAVLMTTYELKSGIYNLHLLAHVICMNVAIEQLRDETYAQICKQLSDNPHQESTSLGIRILSTCLAFFPPSQTLYKYLAQFIATRIPPQLGAYLQFKLQRVFTNGSRKTLPSLSQVISDLQSAQYEVEILLPSGAIVVIFVDSLSTTNEIIYEAMSSIKVTSYPGWQLSFVAANYRYYIVEKRYLYDILPSAVEEVQSSKTLRLGIQLLLSKEHFEPGELVRDDICVDLITKSILPRLKTSTIQLNAHGAANLIAIQRYLTQEVDKAAIHVGTTLFGTKLGTLSMIDVEANLLKAMEFYQKCASDAVQLRKAFISAASEFYALFGDKFIVNCKSSAEKIEKIFSPNTALQLCIDQNGLHFSPPDSCEYTYGLPLSESMITTEQENVIRIRFSVSCSVAFQSAECDIVQRVLENMVASARKYSKWAQATGDQAAQDDTTMLQFQANDIIMILERKQNDEDWLFGRNESVVGSEPGWFHRTLVQLLLSKPTTIETRSANDQLSELASKRSSMQLPIPVVAEPLPSPGGEQSLKEMLLDWAITQFKPDEKKKGKSSGIVGTIRRLTVNEVSSKDIPEFDTAKLKQRLSYTAVPMTTSLLKLSAEEERFSVDMFQNVMRFMGDYPTKDVTSVDIARAIICRCLDSSLMFKTELYSQLLRQLSDNTRPASENKGWALLQLVSRYFSPSPELLVIVMKWLRSVSQHGDAERSMAATSISQNLNTTKNASRKVHPTPEEMTYQELGRPLSVTLNFLDKSSKKVVVTACTMVSEVVQQMCRKLDIKNCAFFGLFYEHDGKHYLCGNDEFVLDSIYNNPEPPAQPASKAVKPIPKRLYFRKIVWKKGVAPANSNELHLMCSQMISMHLMAFNRSTLGECTSLAALQAKISQLDTVGKDSSFKEETYCTMIPPTMWPTVKPDVWVSEVDKQIAKFNKLDVNTARHEVLRLSSSWPVFGSSLYQISMAKCDRIALPDQALLALTPEGVSVLNISTKVSVVSWPYGELSGWSYAPDRINIKVGSLMEKVQTTLKANTVQGAEICYIVGLYVQTGGANVNKA